MRRQNTEKRFWSKVEKRGPDECWLWKGRRDRLGYGAMMFRRKVFTAHRLAYLLTRGEFDQSLDCCHTCDTPSCCNPKHLWLGTAKDNVRDAIKKGRFPRGDRIGTSRLNHQLVSQIIKEYTYGHKGCPEIAKQLGVSVTCVFYIVSGRTWKHVTGGKCVTRPPRGETLRTSGLKESDVITIRRIRKTNGTTFNELARMFKISTQSAFDVVNGKTWKHI